MERLASDDKYSQTSSDSILLEFVRSQSAEMALKDRYSSKLKPDQEYSLTSTIKKVNAGERFQISAWVHDPRDHCRIISSSDGPNQFYYSRQTIEIEDSLGWRHIQSDFFVPEE